MWTTRPRPVPPRRPSPGTATSSPPTARPEGGPQPTGALRRGACTGSPGYGMPAWAFPASTKQMLGASLAAATDLRGTDGHHDAGGGTARVRRPLEIAEVEVEEPRPVRYWSRSPPPGCAARTSRPSRTTAPSPRNSPHPGPRERRRRRGRRPRRHLVKPGDHVIVAMNGPCGRCRNCSRGRAYLCSGQARMAAIMGMMADGSTRLTLDGAAVRPLSASAPSPNRPWSTSPPGQGLPRRTPRSPFAHGLRRHHGCRRRPQHRQGRAGLQRPGGRRGGVGLNVIQGAVLAGRPRSSPPTSRSRSSSWRRSSARRTHPAVRGSAQAGGRDRPGRRRLRVRRHRQPGVLATAFLRPSRAAPPSWSAAPPPED